MWPGFGVAISDSAVDRLVAAEDRGRQRPPKHRSMTGGFITGGVITGGRMTGGSIMTTRGGSLSITEAISDLVQAYRLRFSGGQIPRHRHRAIAARSLLSCHSLVS
jgi:hypothetical protein